MNESASSGFDSEKTEAVVAEVADDPSERRVLNKEEPEDEPEEAPEAAEAVEPNDVSPGSALVTSKVPATMSLS